MQNDKVKIRRYDIDWLRVLVFGLLIIYHVGMFFVNWDWHLKNNLINYDLGWPMAFVNRWRLHILFVISGMGTYYALAYRSSFQFALERIKRLGIPLVFGMLLLIPPQLFLERLANNQFQGSYWNFLATEAFQGIEWNHLWFLPYLLTYSLILIPVFIYIRKNTNNIFTRTLKKMLTRSWTLYLLVIPLFFAEAFLEPFFPTNHSLTNDWFAFTNFIILFFYGFILISVGDVFWKALDKIKIVALLVGIIAFTILFNIWYLEDTVAKHLIEAFVYVTNTWSWILTIFGFSAKYLNKKSRLLSYSNRAVYPFYILHQTVIIIIAYQVKDLDWSFTTKFSCLTFGTFLICWLIYDLIILRLPILHTVFGLKKTKNIEKGKASYV